MIDLKNFDTMLATGRITRYQWTGRDDNGRVTACILAAIFPQAGAAKSASVCPSDQMWPWLAHLTPWINDFGSEGLWQQVVQRYAKILHNLHRLDAADGKRLELVCKRIFVSEARSHARPGSHKTLEAIDLVIELIDLSLACGEPTSDERIQASVQLDLVLDRLGWLSSSWRLSSSSSSALSAMGSVPDSAIISARKAADTAFEAADVGTSMEARFIAKAAASDRMIDAVLTTFEAAIAAKGLQS
jgi:hypothetical protein